MLNVKQDITSEELYNKLSKSHSADIHLNDGIMHYEMIRAKNKHYYAMQISEIQ